jgi:lantibiotic modifying enzyme
MQQRLGSMLQRFPELAHLWLHLISQWQRHIREVLVRFGTDRRELAELLFADELPAKITDIRPSLSEPHHGGRSVTHLVLDTGSVIYKPRTGDSEWEWNDLMRWMNKQSFKPALRPVEVLRRKNYCWMEYVEAARCRDKAATRRFFERLGGLIAAAHVLRAVDCHRENLIASGEWPILVDADALWHVSPLTKTQSVTNVFYRTGFFPNRRRQSLQSRSSVLGPAAAGFHLPHLNGKLARPHLFAREIVNGFEAAWLALLGTAARRASLQRRLRRIRSGPRRWIYRATATYAAILQESLQPALLRSATERAALIRHRCESQAFSPAVLEAEVASLLKLDIPYFIRRTNEWLPPDKATPPFEVIEAIYEALLW